MACVIHCVVFVVRCSFLAVACFLLFVVRRVSCVVCCVLFFVPYLFCDDDLCLLMFVCCSLVISRRWMCCAC